MFKNTATLQGMPNFKQVKSLTATGQKTDKANSVFSFQAIMQVYIAVID
jgi:hypothetical protein